MKHYEIEEIDSNRYQFLKYEEPIGGSRPRIILQDKKTKSKFLLKTYNHNSREVWAELLASKIGKLLDLNIQNVSVKKMGSATGNLFKTQNLPANWQPVGALIRNAFPPKHDIFYGQRIVGDDSAYLKLEDIEQSIRNKYYAPEDLLQAFAKMVVFDAFIGNMDRHHQNWGIVEHQVVNQMSLLYLADSIKNRYFATLFDHGSSLLFELAEEDVKRYIDQPDLFEKVYILGKQYTFFKDSDGNASNVFSLIKCYIKGDKKNWGKRFKKAIEPYHGLQVYDLAKSLMKMPQHEYIDYSENRKRLLLNSLIFRKKTLEGLLL